MQDSAGIQIFFPGGQTYQPGVTQQLRVSVTDPMAAIFGFQLSARDSQNQQAGTLRPVDATTLVVSQGGVQYIGHAGPLADGTFTFEWTPPAAAVDAITLYAAANAANGNGQPSGDRIHVRSFALSPGLLQPTLGVTEGGVVNAASFQPGMASGSWVSIFGQGLAPAARTWRNDEIQNGVLPTELDGVRVRINGKDAAVFFISPTQLNVQPSDDDLEGPTQLEVVRNGVSSPPVTVQLQRFAPGFFMFEPEERKYLAAVHPDGVLVGKPDLFQGVAARPARPGDLVVLFGTGFGPTEPRVPAGRVFTGAASLTNPVTIRIGDTDAAVLFAGLSGAGLYQFNVRVPDGLSPGDSRVVAEIGGLQSQARAFLTIGAS